MTTPPVIMWFRQDLRLRDNPALHAAAQAGSVIPVYIFDEHRDWPMGAASRVWLHHSLEALAKSLGGKLYLASGRTADILPKLARLHKVATIYCNSAYDPAGRAMDQDIAGKLAKAGVGFERSNGLLLIEPDANLKPDGTYYKVFSAFRKKHYPPHRSFDVLPAPRTLDLVNITGGNTLDKLKFLPDKLDWHGGMMKDWQPGEEAAQKGLKSFVDDHLKDYNTARDRPALPGVSRLSPRLHHGELSPRQVWQAVQAGMAAHGLETGGDRYLSEIAWREFNYHLLWHFTALPDAPFQPRFEKFKWSKSPEIMQRWQQGQTGYPLVDAGMRQLWQTGWMHNRVRLVVGSFLVKDLLLHWRDGAAWFWDCLVDADLANNSANWQWVAGCGADAAPYFRIFNPITQSKKFDPEGAYIRTWVPELADLPKKYIHDPSSAPAEVLQKAKVTIGETYPAPVVAHDAARGEALTRFRTLKGA